MNFIKKSNAAYLLTLNAVLWGSSYVLNKLLLQHLPMFTVLFLFSLGGFLSTAFLFKAFPLKLDKRFILLSLPVSLFSIVSNLFCMLSLKNNDSSVTAFVVQTSVIITPLVMAIFTKRKPEGKMIATAIMALAGIFFITVRLEDFYFDFHILLALGNALFFSLYLSGQKIISEKVDAKQFTVFHYLFHSSVFIIPAILEHGTMGYKNLTFMVLPLTLSGIFFAVFTVIVQTGAICHVNPEKAALIYTLEPVTALVVAALFAGERPDGIKTLVGCTLILLSVVSSVLPARPDNGTTKEPLLQKQAS